MGLLDWITDGGGSLFSEGSAGPMTGNAMPPPMSEPMPPAQGLTPDAGTSMPPPYPPGGDPMTAGGVPFSPGGDPMTAGGVPSNGPGLPYPPGGDPMTAGGSPSNGPGLPPASPTPPPQATQPMPPGAVPPPPPQASPGPLPSGGAGPAGGGTGGGGTGGFSLPTMNGGGGILGALGVAPDTARRFSASVGAGLTAAGNSAGKSPFQALSSGAGAAMEGGSKAAETNNKQTNEYLNTAIKAKQQGDEAGYKTNYLKYLAAKLDADTKKAADKDSGNKNDSPTQLYLRARSEVSKDKEVTGSLKILEGAIREGDPEKIKQAQAAHSALVQKKQEEAFAGLGLHPQTIAEVAKQPGNSPENPVDAKSAGITKDNIAKKLQPGQYYINPKDGKPYIYQGAGKGEKAGVKGVPNRPTSPEPADPLKPEKGTRISAASSDDED